MQDRQILARRRPFAELGGNVGSQPVAPKDKPKALDVSKNRLTNAAVFSPTIDERYRNDPLYVVETYREIYEHFLLAETKRRPNPGYMAVLQTDVNEKMRAILVDWLVDVHLKFKLLPETFFLAVEVIDRFLDKKVVNRQKLQLVGVVAMLLAAKYEEIYPPEVKDFIYIAANTYSRDDILRMERLIFQTLDFNITIPTVFVFLKRALQVCDADAKTSHATHFFAELAAMEYTMLKHMPSLIGATCVYLAHKTVGNRSQIQEHYLHYKTSDLEQCAEDILAIVRASPSLKTQAIRRKYSYAKFSEVSKLIDADRIQIP